MHRGFWWENLSKIENLEDLSADGRVILKWMLKTQDEGIYWIDLAQVRDKWRATVKRAMNLRFP